MAGYSRKSLAEKLGLRPGQRRLFQYTPRGYMHCPDRSPGRAAPSTATVDFIQAFFTSARRLRREFPKLKRRLAPDGQLWISWPKKTGRVGSDLNENIVRDFGLRIGLVDVKVIAVDDNWSGLKFVFRLTDRKKKHPRVLATGG